MEREMEWQPIETAPRDGTRVLVYQKDWCEDGGSVFEARVNRYGGWGDPVYREWTCEPTYWRPIPAPPRTEQGANVGNTPDHVGK